jgi:arsenite methyltransferase
VTFGERSPSDLIKGCCATAWESDAASWLLGDSFHPGGLTLTERLGRALKLTPQTRVLDLACGRGTSALFLADCFGCEVVGIDLSEGNIQVARKRALSRGLASRVSFERRDGEMTCFPDEAFDAVLCECAFCLFPDKGKAAREIARLLRRGGFLGLSDIVRSDALPAEFDALESWIACVADAQPIETLVDVFGAAGLTLTNVENHREALTALVDDVRGRLFGAEVLSGLQKIRWPDFDFKAANRLARLAQDAALRGALSYASLTMRKSEADLQIDAPCASMR